MRQLRRREVKQLAQGHVAGEWHSQDGNLGPNSVLSATPVRLPPESTWPHVGKREGFGGDEMIWTSAEAEQ